MFSAKSFYSLLVLFLLITSINAQTLPTGTSTLFSGSGNCEQCHTGNGNILFENGIDISPVTTWRSSMMGNSSKDPLWRAMVSEEVSTFPSLQSIIEDRCTNCHAPMGYTEAIFNGAEHYSMAELYTDSLANDGVSCTLCHQIQAGNLGQDISWSGGFDIENSSTIFGPYPDPFQTPMFNMTGYNPVEGAQVHESDLCATCHTLFTPYVDYEGNIAGMFPEQTPYLEWWNSSYPDQDVQCQTCHMPLSDNPVVITSMPPWYNELRSPFWKHWFVGSNAYINSILGENVQELGLYAEAVHYDSTIARTIRNLQENTINLEVEEVLVGDSVHLNIRLENLAGHKLPTGIPLRRIWLHLTAWSAEDEIVFESGDWDDNGQIYGLDDGFEPHHDIISENDQVAIYEAVLGDVNNDVTFTLLRAAGLLKDNRIPPNGFTNDGPFADTTAIYGSALSDADFNLSNGQEGSGADIVHYHLPQVNRYSVEVCFQILKPEIAEHLAEIETPEAETFSQLYSNFGNSPIILADVEGTLTQVKDQSSSSIPSKFGIEKIWPNPFNNQTSVRFNLNESSRIKVAIFDVQGRRIADIADEFYDAGEHEILLNSSADNLKLEASGIYFIRLKSDFQSDIKRAVYLK